MSWPYEIRGGTVWLEPEDGYALVDVERTLDAVRVDPRFRRGMRVFTDLRRSDRYLTRQEVRELGEYLSAARADISEYGILVHHVLHYGHARTLGIILETRGVSMSVFRDVRQARSWAERSPAQAA